jgi:hypothetical protein
MATDLNTNIICPTHGPQKHWNRIGMCGICERKAFNIGWKIKHPFERRYVMAALGFGDVSDAKMPKDFEGTFDYEGVVLKVYPSKIHPVVGYKSSKHRVFAVCVCGREIPFGRIHQHLPACKGGK